MAGTCTAELFRDRDAEETHAGQPLPQLAVIGLLPVAPRAHRLGWAFFGEKLPGFVAEFFLFVGEIEIHGVPLLMQSRKFSSSSSPRKRGPIRRAVSTWHAGRGPFSKTRTGGGM